MSPFKPCLLVCGLLTAATLCSAALPWHWAGPVASVQAAEPAWPEMKWEALVPPDWNPMAEFKGLDLANLQDNDPRAAEILARLRKVWDDAPVDPTLDGRKLRIAGFVIPLEQQGDKVTEFLIVPYFGACIHTPPPPANQIIHVVLQRPVKGFETMDTVWVHGTLRTERQNSEMGVSGYRIDAVRVAPYERRSPEPAC